MDLNVFIEKIDADVLFLTNNTGVDINQYDFLVLENYAAIAMEEVANGASGPFRVADGTIFQAAGATGLKAGEDTFATRGQEVFYDPVARRLSDTATVGYYAVGKLNAVKTSGNMIKVDKYRFADPVLSDET